MNTFILLSAGIGNRMGESIPKQFLMLRGKPIILHSLEKVDQIDEINEVIIVCQKEYLKIIENLIANHSLKDKYICVEGGDTRQQSVFNGLSKATNNSVIIHEAVRPFVSIKDYRRILNNKNENVIYGININFTVLKGTKIITDILERDSLINVQLPQKFNKDKLLLAHKKAREEGKTFTEDASLLFFYEKEIISVMEGNEYNIKITTPLDIVIGEMIYKEYILNRSDL